MKANFSATPTTSLGFMHVPIVYPIGDCDYGIPDFARLVV